MEDNKRLRHLIEYIWDGEEMAMAPLLWIRGNVRCNEKVFEWLYRNRIQGKKFLMLFKNESLDGGGYANGVSFILRKMNRKLRNELY